MIGPVSQIEEKYYVEQNHPNKGHVDFCVRGFEVFDCGQSTWWWRLLKLRAPYRWKHVEPPSSIDDSAQANESDFDQILHKDNLDIKIK